MNSRRLRKEILAKQVDLGTSFDFDVAVDLGAAGQPHRVLVPNISQGRDGVRQRRGNYRLELEPFAERQLVGVLNPFRNQHPASAAEAQPMTVEEAAVQRTTDAIDEADVGEDSGLERFGAQVRAVWHLDLLLLLDELDDG